MDALVQVNSMQTVGTKDDNQSLCNFLRNVRLTPLSAASSWLTEVAHQFYYLPQGPPTRRCSIFIIRDV
jgi:hypothetical protein